MMFPFRHILKVQKMLSTLTKKRLTTSIRLNEPVLQGCCALDDLALHLCVHLN